MTIHQKTLNKTSSWGRKPNFLSSIKNNQFYMGQSILEPDYILTKEFDRQIINDKPQPISIISKINEKKRQYTPDLLISNTDDVLQKREKL